jgi:hypothetical protein
MALDMTNISPEACRKYLSFDMEIDESQHSLVQMFHLVHEQ